MISIKIPEFGELNIDFLVLDFNGVIAVDGKLLPGVPERLMKLSRMFRIFVLTADTFGTAQEQCKGLPLEVVVLKEKYQKEQKGDFVKRLGRDKVCSIGNGNVDIEMLREAALSIVVIGGEACSSRAMQATDIVVSKIEHALDLLLNPKRLIATLRE